MQINLKMNEKKAISGTAIIAIIILIFAGLVLIIGFVIPKAGEGINAGSACFDPRITISTKAGYTCFDATSREIRVQLARGPVEYELVGMDIYAVIDGRTEKFDVRGGMLNVNEQNVYSIILNSSIIGEPTFVAVAPLIKKRETTVTCGIAARAELTRCI